MGRAIAAVGVGERFYSASFLRLQRERQQDPRSFVKRLTEKQREVLGLLGEGLTNEEVAARLGIGVGTAKAHRSAIMRGLEILTSSKLIHYALTRGFTRLRCPSSRGDVP